MGRKLTLKIKSKILEMILRHVSIPKIAKKVKKNKSVIYEFFNKLKASGQFVRTPGSGRNQILSNEEKRKIVSATKMNPFTSSKQIRKASILKEKKISRKAAKKPRLTPIQKRNRFKLAKNGQNFLLLIGKM